MFYGRFFLSAVDNVVDAVIDWYFEWETEKKEGDSRYVFVDRNRFDEFEEERKEEGKEKDRRDKEIGR